MSGNPFFWPPWWSNWQIPGPSSHQQQQHHYQQFLNTFGLVQHGQFYAYGPGWPLEIQMGIPGVTPPFVPQWPQQFAPYFMPQQVGWQGPVQYQQPPVGQPAQLAQPIQPVQPVQPVQNAPPAPPAQPAPAHVGAAQGQQHQVQQHPPQPVPQQELPPDETVEEEPLQDDEPVQPPQQPAQEPPQQQAVHLRERDGEDDGKGVRYYFIERVE